MVPCSRRFLLRPDQGPGAERKEIKKGGQLERRRERRKGGRENGGKYKKREGRKKRKGEGKAILPIDLHGN